MCAVSPLARFKAAISICTGIFLLADVQSKHEAVVGIPFDADVTKKKVAAPLSDPLLYKRNDVWITIIQVSGLRNLFRTVLQKHENELLRLLGVKNYQCGVGLVTTASTAARKLGDAHSDSTADHLQKERILKAVFLLAGSDGCHRRLSNQKLATYRQSNKEWASQSTSLALITTSGSEVFTEHKLLRLSSPAILLLGLVT